MGRYHKWCPNGCGKSLVFYDYKIVNNKRISLYYCDRCNSEFDKKFLKENNFL